MRLGISWMGRDGPCPTPKIYKDVTGFRYEEDGRRLVIEFARYSVHLFTRNIAEVEVE